MTDSVKRIHRALAEDVAVTVTSSLTELGDYDVSDMDAVGFSMANDGTALDQFEISFKFSKEDDWVVVFNAAGDFTTPTGILIGASGDLTIIADAATGWFLLYSKGTHSMRLRAASSGADTVVTVNGGGS